MTTNLKRIPFIPKLSREFKPMRHYLCETDTSAKLISRTAFMRQLAQQPCPKGQVFIDFDDGIVYLFPFDPERAAQFTVAYGEFETEYKCFYREQEAIRAGRRMTVVHLDQFDDSEAAATRCRAHGWYRKKRRKASTLPKNTMLPSKPCPIPTAIS